MKVVYDNGDCLQINKSNYLESFMDYGERRHIRFQIDDIEGQIIISHPNNNYVMHNTSFIISRVNPMCVYIQHGNNAEIIQFARNKFLIAYNGKTIRLTVKDLENQ